MEQPNTESTETPETATTPTETANTTTESPETTQENETSKPERFNFLDEEAEDKPTTEKPVDGKTPVKPAEETTETKPVDDEITIEKDGKTQKLVAFKDDAGTILGYIPEDKKADNGFLRQADYTKKTTDLKTKEQELTELEQSVKSQKEQAQLLAYVDQIGYPKPKPVSDPMGDLRKPDGTEYENGEQMLGKDGKPNGKVVYSNMADYNEAQEAHEVYLSGKSEIENTQKNVRESNLKMFESFAKEVGEERAKETYAEVVKYLNPLTFKELSPYPENALKMVHKGLNYDKDMAAKEKEIEGRINAAVLKKVKELEGKSTKTTPVPQNNAPNNDTAVNVPARYAFVTEN
jgi:hypothetical protein